MKGYSLNIEQETLNNTDYRRVLYTTKNSQLVLMSLKPGQEIGQEVHELDQFIRFEAGEATVVLNDVRHAVGDGDAVVIPEGTRHNVINTGATDLKLYTVYAPPEHRDHIVEHDKADEFEEHFDGKTSE